MSSIEGKVLIVTGGFLSGKERNFFQVIKRQILQWKFTKFSWLETGVKFFSLEPIIYVQSKLRRTKDLDIKNFFAKKNLGETPELTEVILATLLEAAGMKYEVTTIDDLFSDAGLRTRLLQETNCVFLSTTLLRDLSEMTPILDLIKRPHNRIVVGGPLAQLVKEHVHLLKQVDVVALGYGEFVVPELVEWVKSHFTKLQIPDGGKIEKNGHVQVIYSGHPKTTSLDSLPSPDWSLAQKVHNADFPVIHYESVRGCPYRCSFCNYPFLFNEDSFRYRSAAKIADDWERYEKELGPRIINCLDSLFTMPRKRLFELCDLIVSRNLKSQWICYARAEDMAKDEVCIAMKKANVLQVQIGLETGSAQLLKNMNKNCTLEENIKAIENCRKYGITSVVSLIAGFPGETKETIEETYQLMKKVQPDFFFIATFSTRAQSIPILNEENKKKFGIWVDENVFTVSPYWEHQTMGAAEVGSHVRDLQFRIMRDGFSLNAFCFYAGMLNYLPEHREKLLKFQKEAVLSARLLPKVFGLAEKFIAHRIARDIVRLKKKKEILTLNPA